MAEKIHHRACHLCEAICGLNIVVDGDKIESIKGDPEDPLSRGHICPKAIALKDIHNDPDRLRSPVKRVGDDWQTISWQQAFEEIADKLLAIRAAHGADSLAIYAGNPSVHNYGMMTHPNYTFAHLKTRNRFSATSVDQLPHQLVSYWMYGHQLLVPIPDIDHTDYFLMLGANPLASNGSIMTVPDIKTRIQAIQKRGGKLVLIDPRRTETAAVADEHLFIKPGSDVFFLLAILNTLFEQGLADTGAAAQWLDNWQAVAPAVSAYTPEAVTDRTGIAASDIRRIAQELAMAKSGVCYGRLGVSVQQFGTLCQWLIQLINIATGNFDRRGGTLFPLPAVDMIAGAASKPGHFDVWRSRVRGLPEFGGELPVAALAEEILTPGEGQVKALMTLAGNPVLSTPNGRQLETALAQLDYMVAVDFYINETTRFADIILPPTSPLEHDHYDTVFLNFAVRNTARFNPPIFDKPGDALHDWEIFMGLGEVLAQKLDTEPLPAMAPDQMMDFGLQTGPYGNESEHGLSLEKLARHPSGIDLGPMQPSCPDRLQSESKRINAAPAPLLEDLNRVAQVFAQDDDTELKLIGRRHVRSNNSWLHNSHRLVKGKPRCQLLMHPEDVATWRLVDGGQALLSSRVGEIVVDIASTDDIMPGTVSLPHGWGHQRPGVKLAVATEHAGVSVNDITDEHFLDDLSGNSALNGVPVKVTALNR